MKEEKDLKNSTNGMSKIGHQEEKEADQKEQQNIQQFVSSFEEFLNDC